LPASPAATAVDADLAADVPLRRSSHDRRPASSVHEGKDLSAEAGRYQLLSLALFGVG
jgi:hypothetical protein